VRNKAVAICEIRLLGPPTVLKGDTVVSGLRHKSIALLAFLGVEDRPISRDTLATLLWPERGQAAARRNLRTCLFDISAHVDRELLVTTRETVALSAKKVTVDVPQFLRSAESSSDSGLIEAVSRYTADFLEGFTLPDCRDFDSWQFTVTESLRNTLQAGLLAIVEGFLASCEPEQAMKYWQRLVALDPLEEAFHRLGMRLYAASGQWTAALNQFDECVRILHEELDEEPDDVTRELEAMVRARDPNLLCRRPAGSEALGSAFVAPPEELDRFFDRSEELQTLDRLIRSGTRVIVVVGPPGIGKTRLAVHAVHVLSDRFVDGTVFVDLTQVTDGSLVPGAVAAACGLRRRSVESAEMTELLAKQLGGRHVLLFLDNFEHVMSAAPEIERFVKLTDTPTLLVTSREPTWISGESIVYLSPLEVPAGNDQAEAGQTASVQLFCERASAHIPSFNVDAEQMPGIVSICRQLDGVPLALELAVPYLRVFSAAELAERLISPLSYLSAEAQSLPERHRSLQRAIDWSYNLLDAEEKRLFVALASFGKGFTFVSVETICGELCKTRPLHLVFRSLVNKSLLLRSAHTEEPRFSLLEPTREYALGKEMEDGELPAIRERHAKYFRVRALEAEPLLHGEDQAKWTAQLEGDHTNLLRALEYFDGSNRFEDGMRMATALTWFWYQKGHFTTGERWLGSFLERATPNPSSLRARAIDGRGWLRFVMGDWRRSHNMFAESLYMARQVEDRACEVLSLSNLGVCERWLGNTELGAEYVNRAVEVARGIGEPYYLARALVWAYSTTGGVFQGPPPIEELEEALLLANHIHDPWLCAHACNGLGDLLCERGRYDESLRCYEQALDGFVPLGDRFLTAWTLEGMGRVELGVGLPERAIEFTTQALIHFDELGDALHVALMLSRLAQLAVSVEAAAHPALLGGAAFAMLSEPGIPELRDTPQITQAREQISGMADKWPEEWVEGSRLTRGQVVSRIKASAA